MDIKLYANAKVLEGLEANGHSIEELKERLRQTMLDMSSLTPRTDVSTDAGTDVNKLQEAMVVLNQNFQKLKTTVTGSSAPQEGPSRQEFIQHVEWTKRKLEEITNNIDEIANRYEY